jgi:hypothetical protein
VAIITEACIGKTFLATALGHAAVRLRFTVHFERCDRLFKRLLAEELAANDMFEVTISFGELPKRFAQRRLGRDIFWWFQRWGVMDRTRQDAVHAQSPPHPG